MILRLQQSWYRRDWLSHLLLPLAWLFHLLVAMRRAAYRGGLLSRARPAAPVVVVGNLTVGGAGKTPLVIELARRLRAAGYNPGVVSRGYGAAPPAVPHRVSVDDDPSVCGDEPLLIARASACPVVVFARRVEAAAALVAEGCDLILADDGLQHYALDRDLEVLVVDGERRFGNRRLLPAGPLREPLGRLGEVDLVCFNGRRAEDELGFDLRPESAHPLQGGAPVPLAEWRGQRVHAVAGIAAPRRFFTALRQLGLEPVEHPFPDHHPFAAADLEFGDDAPVLMTEKDAVKCERFARPHWFGVPVSVALDPQLWTRFLQLLDANTHG